MGTIQHHTRNLQILHPCHYRYGVTKSHLQCDLCYILPSNDAALLFAQLTESTVPMHMYSNGLGYEEGISTLTILYFKDCHVKTQHKKTSGLFTNWHSSGVLSWFWLSCTHTLFFSPLFCLWLPFSHPRHHHCFLPLFLSWCLSHSQWVTPWSKNLVPEHCCVDIVTRHLKTPGASHPSLTLECKSGPLQAPSLQQKMHIAG